MTLVNIDLRNQGYETSPGDRVVFYSLLVREGDFGTISTAPVEVELVDGKATVDLAPGPVGVQIIAGQVADTRIKIGEVPRSGTTTLNAVMLVTPAYTPALQAAMIAAIERAKEVAVGQIDAEAALAVDEEIGEFKSKAEQALTKSTAAESKSDTALSKSTTAESSAGNAVSRVSALEAMSGLSPESPVDGQTANLILQPSTLTHTALNATYPTFGLEDRRRLPDTRIPHHPAASARGAVVFTWDDGLMTQYNTVVQLASELGQKHTFFVPINKIDLSQWYFSTEHIQELHQDGHEIGSHTVSENSTGMLKDLDPVDREYEYDYSKEALENILGPDTVTSFAYAMSVHSYSFETTRELFGRYGRALVSATPSLGLSLPGNTGFLVGRTAWNSETHARVLELIRLVRESGMTLCLSAHMNGDLTEAELEEAMRLVHDLGVATLTCREAFPSAVGLANHSFESDSTAWGFQKAGDATGEVVYNPEGVQPGIFGDRYLRLTSPSASASNWVYAHQSVPLYPHRTYQLSFLYRQILTAGAPDVAPTVRFAPQAHTPDLPPPKQTVIEFGEGGPRFFDDFSSNPTGVGIPAGWVEKWRTGVTWSIVEDGGALGGKVLRATGGSPLGMHGLALAEVGNQQDVEILFRWKAAAENSWPGAIVRGTGEDESTATGFNIRRTSLSYLMGMFNEGTLSTLGGGYGAPSEDVWYLTRFRVQGGTIYGKRWDASGPEPADWTTTHDISALGVDDAGWAGLLVNSAGDVDFDWVSVAVKGGTALMPGEEDEPDLTWHRQIVEYTPPPGTGFVAVHLRLPPQYVGELHFDHLHWGPRELGSYG